MGSKMYIASKPVGFSNNPYKHLYLVHDTDGNINTTDDQTIFRASGDSNDKIVIENWVPEDESQDALNGDNPLLDRNYTEIANGQDADALKSDISDWARTFDQPDPNDIVQTDVPYTSPIEFDGPILNDVPSLNSNTTIRSALAHGGYDVSANMPHEDGDTLKPRLTETSHPGMESQYSGGSETINIGSANENKIIYSDGGDTTYELTPHSLDKGKITIVPDNDPNTTDKLVIKGMDPNDITFMRHGNDLNVYMPWDEEGNPSVVIKDQWDENGVPRMNTLWVEPPGGGTPVVIPLNDPGDFSPYVPASGPGWIDPAGSKYDDAPNETSPLVIDADKDGSIELTTFNATSTTTFFDLDNDGFAEQTAWVAADDALLARDVDSSGVIDDASELFGSATLDGFAKLSELDSNGDLVISDLDDAWSELVLWQDSNGDAYSQSTELQSLTAWNIKSIDLAGVTSSTATINGNPISHESTLTYTDDTTGKIVDAWFVHDQLTTSYVQDYTLDLAASYMPTLRGFGELPDLDVAMSLDNSGTGNLKALVGDFIVAWDWDKFGDTTYDDDFADILYRWAGVDGVPTDSRGPAIDARKLEFLEKFFGENFRQYSYLKDPGGGAAELLEGAWKLLFDNMKSFMLVQSGADAIFSSAPTYDVHAGELDGTFDIDGVIIDSLESYATAQGVDTEKYWSDVALFLSHTKGFSNFTTAEDTLMNDSISSTDPNLSWTAIKDSLTSSNNGSDITGTVNGETLTGSIYDDTIQAYGGDDTLNGNAGDDTLYGGGGNDILNPSAGGDFAHGGTGDDSYYYAGGDDVYSDSSGSGDKIYMPTGIDANDLTFTRIVDYDLLIDVNTMGTILIDAQFLVSQNDIAIEKVVFADSSEIDLATFTGFTTYGTEGDDNFDGISTYNPIDETIYGLGGDDFIEARDGNDTIDGGAGNDTLYGGSGDDTYIFSPGFDLISESGGTDTIHIPEGYNADDLHIYRHSSSTNDLFITVDGLGQMKLSYQHYYHSSVWTEYITFADGDPTVDILGASVETRGTTGNDNVYGVDDGASNNDILNGLAGDDTLYGNDGNDTYIFSEGSDLAIDYGAGNDTLEFRNNYTEEDISILRTTRSTGIEEYNDLVVVGQNGNKILFSGHFSNNAANPSGSELETILFSDSSTINVSQMEIETHGTSGDDDIDPMYFGDASEDDTIFGYAGNDTINGGNGEDVLDGGAGNDSLMGGAGNDTIIVSAGDDFDYVNGQAGTDTLMINGFTINEISVVDQGWYNTAVKLDPGVDEVTLSNFRYPTQAGHTEIIAFKDGFSTSLPDYNSWNWGTSSGETLSGTTGADTIIGKGGDDTLNGDVGADDIHGGTGNDTVNAGNGDDLLHGGAGNDWLYGQNGADTIYGGAGDDTLYGQDGLDVLWGGAGADEFMFGGSTAFNFADLVKDFDITNDGDAINLIGLLASYDPLQDAITDFVEVTDSGSDSVVKVDTTGTGNFGTGTQIATLEGVKGLTDEAALESSGTLLTSA